MRASSVFILALALLVGLAVAAGAKSAGLFDKKAPPPATEKPAPLKVLVAKTPLFEDVIATVDSVRVRDLQPEEEAQLIERYGKNWKEKAMPPSVSAAHLRLVKQNIPAEAILFRDQFAEAGLPERITTQLEPNTRAVNVSVSKDKAAGGVLRVGEYVDVLLTTKVGSGGQEELRTACVARGCKVMMKRNVPWNVMAVDPDDKQMHFTLQANAYRAALIDFAQTHGQISLMPVSAPLKTGTNTFSDPSSREYATEDQRVDDVVRGTRTIGNEDLARIFQLTAPPGRLPPPPPLRVQHLSGVSPAGETILPGATQPAAPVQPAGGSSDAPSDAPPAGAAVPKGDPRTGYTFRLPSATGDSGCKDCDEAKKKAAEAAKYQTVRPAN